MKIILNILLVIVLLSACSDNHKAGIVKSQFIFENQPFEACHASTIVELGNEVYMAAWFGGSYEGCNDVCIYTALYKEGQWETPRKVAVGKIDSLNTVACWNPVLFKASNQILYLFYKVGMNPREWWGMVKTSTDRGKTWGQEIKLPEGFFGPIRCKPIQLTDGTIVCPSSTESLDEKWKVHIELVDDSLTRWEKVLVDTSNKFKVIQPTLLVHEDGAIQMLCRSNQNCIVQSWSYDSAKTWSKLSCIDLPNPNSGIDAINLSDGRFLMVYNPLFHGEDWYLGRNILKVALSDDGMTWQEVLILENHAEGEYSYPAVIQADDGKIHITYTANRKDIKHVVIEL